jgi:hypothetical protein
MATTFINVPSGTTSAVIPVTPFMSVLAGPAVLGGTTTLNVSPNPAGPTANFLPWSFGASVNPQSFRTAGPLAGGLSAVGIGAGNAYITVAAGGGQASSVAICDFSGFIGDRSPASLVSINETFASGSATAEQVIGSFRIPPGLMPLNARMRISGGVSMVNNANAKTLQIRVNGLAGTLLFQSPALASNADYNFQTEIGLRGDGVTQIGYGEGTTGGFGLSTTAYRTFNTVNYLLNEIEYVVTVTKATAGDAMSLEGLLVQLV